MANFTISGTGFLPDGVTPLDGFWRVRIVTSNRTILEEDGDWRGGELIVSTVGPTTITLPESEGDESYQMDFWSKDRTFSLGPYDFQLTENLHWTDLIETPVGVPVNPSVLAQVSQLLGDAEDVDDVLVAALVNNVASLTRDALDNLFPYRAGARKISVSNTPPSSPSLNDVWIDIS